MGLVSRTTTPRRLLLLDQKKEEEDGTRAKSKSNPNGWRVVVVGIRDQEIERLIFFFSYSPLAGRGERTIQWGRHCHMSSSSSWSNNNNNTTIKKGARDDGEDGQV